MRSSAAGLGLAVLSAATFGTSGSFAESLMRSGWSPGAAVTVRIAVAALLLTGPALVQLRGRWDLLRRHWQVMAAYGLIAMAGCQLFYFNAVQHLSVSVALLLEYSGTLLVVAWLWARHGERPRPRTSAGAVLALAGLVLVLDLTGHQRTSGVGLLWGAAAAVGLAIYFTVSARAAGTVPPIVLAWAGMVVGAVTLGLAGLLGVIDLHASAADVRLAGWRTSWLVPVLGLSLLATAVGYSTGIAAARRLGARLASFVGLAEVLCAVVFAWILLGQTPTLLQAIGGAVVLAGIALVRSDDAPAPADSAASSVPESVLESVPESAFPSGVVAPTA